MSYNVDLKRISVSRYNGNAEKSEIVTGATCGISADIVAVLLDKGIKTSKDMQFIVDAANVILETETC